MGVLVLLHLGLGATPQASDLLITLGQDGTAAAWAGLWAGTAWLALNTWFWSRFALLRGSVGGWVAAAMPSALAATALGVVADALRTAAASVPEAMGAPGGGGRLAVASSLMGLLCLAALLASLRAGWGKQGVPSPAPARLSRGTWRMWGVSVAVGVAGLAGFGADPVRAAAVVQPASIVLLAAAGLISGGTLLLDLGQRTRVPALLLVLAGAAALPALRDRGVVPDNHALRQTPSPLPSRPGVEDAFLRFLEASSPADGGPAPVVLVAASGGGIAAAYWTATVLGDLADASPGFASRVFAMSGVSGGAVGLLAYKAMQQPRCRNPGAAGTPATEGFRACLQLALGGEFLGPALGAMLYPDLFQRFVPYPVFPDRAEALERAWEARWQAVSGNGRLAGPFLRLWPDGEAWPALLLNGTSLNRGGRLVVSNLLLGPDHVGGDGGDLLALLGTDLPASAAAGASARFPFIGPLGTFEGPAGRDAVADGGYFENLGASTLLELLDVLDGAARRHGQPVRFVVLQLVNDPRAGSGAPPEDPETLWSLLPRGLTGPATVLLRTREARGVSASEALARRVVALGGAYVPVRLGRSPTGRTAPLGWSLSAVAREVIDGQWTPACRSRVLADAGLDAAAANGRSPPPADPARMDMMAMWSGAACQALAP